MRRQRRQANGYHAHRRPPNGSHPPYRRNREGLHRLGGGTQATPSERGLASTGFNGEAGKTALVPGSNGKLGLVVQGVDADEPIWALAALPDRLPEVCIASIANRG